MEEVTTNYPADSCCILKYIILMSGWYAQFVCHLLGDIQKWSEESCLTPFWVNGRSETQTQNLNWKWCGMEHCLEKMCRTNNFVSSVDVIVLWIEMNIACLVSWSTITRIAEYPEDWGNFLMKSIEIEFQG